MFKLGFALAALQSFASADDYFYSTLTQANRGTPKYRSVYGTVVGKKNEAETEYDIDFQVDYLTDDFPEGDITIKLFSAEASGQKFKTSGYCRDDGDTPITELATIHTETIGPDDEIDKIRDQATSNDANLLAMETRSSTDIYVVVYDPDGNPMCCGELRGTTSSSRYSSNLRGLDHI